MINPNVPIFNMIPDNNMVPCVGAILHRYQVAKANNGKTGILIQILKKMHQNTTDCCCKFNDLPAWYKSVTAMI